MNKIFLLLTFTFIFGQNTYAKSKHFSKDSILRFCEKNGIAIKQCNKKGIKELNNIFGSTGYLLNYKNESFLKAAKENYDTAMLELCQENNSRVNRSKFICIGSDIIKHIN